MNTKKLINKLNDYLRELVVNNEQYEMFVEIKSLLEQQHQHEQNILNYGTDEPEEKQVQPDDELVEEIIKSVTNNSGVVVFSGSAKIVTHKETAKAEIRKLLSRNDFGISCVTREELKDMYYDSALEHTEMGKAFDYFIDRLKSKGFDVKGEK